MNNIFSLSNMRKVQSRFNIFRKRRNNRGMIWTTLLGLGVSAAAVGIKMNKDKKIQHSVQNLMNNLNGQNMAQMPNMAGIVEFSNELLPNNEQNN